MDALVVEEIVPFGKNFTTRVDCTLHDQVWSIGVLITVFVNNKLIGIWSNSLQIFDLQVLEVEIRAML